MRVDVNRTGMPGVEPKAPDTADGGVTTVQVGENKLADVAARLGVSESALQQANPDIGPGGLKPGQDIRLPLLEAPAVPPGQPEADAGGTLADTDNSSTSPARGTRTDRDLSADVIRSRVNGGQRLAGPQGGTAVAKSQFTGLKVGTAAGGQDIHVTREIGSPQGYDDRWEAIGVARLAKTENSAVVQGKDGKWHAVETDASIPKNGAAPGVTVEALPPFSSIQASRQQIKTLQDTSAALGKVIDANRQMGYPVDALEAQQAAIQKQLDQANLQLAANVFGVPESEINFCSRLRDAVPGKINVVAKIDGATGEFHPVKGFNFEQDSRTNPGVVSIRLDQLDDPAHAGDELFHETSHLKDFQLTQHWVDEYAKGHQFVDQYQKPFQDWMRSQVPKNISAADAELVIGNARGDNGDTEARANVHAALEALERGDPALAAKQLSLYADGMKNGKYTVPGNQMQTVLTDELRAAYRQMTPAMQQQLRDAVAAAKQTESAAWVSKLRF